MLKFILVPLSAILNRLPSGGVYLIGNCIGWLWCYVFPFRKRIVIQNIKYAYENELTESQISSLVHNNFLHYGQLIMETLLSVCWKQEDYKKNVSFLGVEYANEAIKYGKGAFFVTCHLGPFELLPGTAVSRGMKADIVVKYARNKTAEAFLKWYRQRVGVNVFLERGTAKDIFKSLSKNRFVGFMMDQFMGPPIGLPVKFFGKEAGTVASLALMTERRDVPVLPVYAYREKRKIIVQIMPPVTYPPLSDDQDQRLFEKTQHLNNILEEIVRSHPEQWLWLHRRWKPFVGRSRWQLKQAFCFMLFTVFSTQALAKGQDKIIVPADPVISVPGFKPQKSLIEDELIADPVVPKVVPIEIADRKEGRKNKKKSKKKPINVSVPRPVLMEKPLFDTVPIDRIPFEIGEKIDFNLTWMGISAGTATMEVKAGPEIGGRRTYEFGGKVLSSKLADTIYHVENEVETFVDREGLIPYKFLLHMDESAQTKETKVIFNHTNSKALYWSNRLSKRWGDEKFDRVDDLIAGAKDLWSGLFYARTLNYALNQKETFFVYENGQNWQVELIPVANELVSTVVGAFQCWKILVVVKLNNVLRPTGDVFMWISDDSKRYIVKFDAKIKLGSLLGTIISVREYK